MIIKSQNVFIGHYLSGLSIKKSQKYGQENEKFNLIWSLVLRIKKIWVSVLLHVLQILATCSSYL